MREVDNRLTLRGLLWAFGGTNHAWIVEKSWTLDIIPLKCQTETYWYDMIHELKIAKLAWRQTKAWGLHTQSLCTIFQKYSPNMVILERLPGRMIEASFCRLLGKTTAAPMRSVWAQNWFTRSCKVMGSEQHASCDGFAWANRSGKTVY